MRWSEAVTLEFVKIYLKHECLWNPSHPGYKLRYQREQAYSDISEEFKGSTMKSLTVPEVKMKIKNLRTTYVQQVHKILQKSSPDSIYEPSLVWFHEMDSCLKHIPSHRHSSSYNTGPLLNENVWAVFQHGTVEQVNHHLYVLEDLEYRSQETQDADLSCQIWVNQGIQSGSTDETSPDPLVPQIDEYVSPNFAEQSSKVKIERRSPSVYYKKNKKKKYKHGVTTKNISTNLNSQSTHEDEFDIYGKYIASQLRKVELHKALSIQLEIQNLVSEARISDMISSD